MAITGLTLNTWMGLNVVLNYLRTPAGSLRMKEEMSTTDGDGTI